MQKDKRIFLLLSIIYVFIGCGSILFLITNSDRSSLSLQYYYTFLFMVYGGIIFFLKKKNNNIFYLSATILSGVTLRLFFLNSTPVLSDDFYRFIWDGSIWWEGINPYTHTPKDLFESMSMVDQERFQHLFSALNSPNYHSVYPPFYQWFFRLTTIGQPISLQRPIVLMQLGIFLFDILSLVLIFKISKLKQELRNTTFFVAVYWLNPLLIFEGVGNLHIENLLISFLLLAYYLWLKGKGHLIFIPIGLAFLTKLLPIVFLAFFLVRKTFKTILINGIGLLLLSIILIFPEEPNKIYLALQKSTQLFIDYFEFNASIYFVVRKIGFWVKGWNVIGIVAPYFTFAKVTLLVGLFSWGWFKRIDPMKLCGLFLTGYYLLSTVVHPWYILVIFGALLFTQNSFVFIWTFLIFITYIGYVEDGYEQNDTLIVLEYVVVILLIIRDILKEKTAKTQEILQNSK